MRKERAAVTRRQVQTLRELLRRTRLDPERKEVQKGMKCLRCNGTGKERKRPNLPVIPCYWCEGTGVEPTDPPRKEALK